MTGTPTVETQYKAVYTTHGTLQTLFHLLSPCHIQLSKGVKNENSATLGQIKQV